MAPAGGHRQALPAVIELHGTGGTKEAMLPFLRELAKRGMMGVAIDARYHGGRTGATKGSDRRINGSLDVASRTASASATTPAR